MKQNILLILAVLIAAIIRFWKLSTLPFPPNGDELAFGYYGWSLLHFGTDEYGAGWPLNFPSIGDYKYPGLSYLNMISALIFGLSDITPRFLSALSGVILVVLVYKLSFFIFNDRKVSIASSWFAALSPWSIVESRLGWENHISMVLTLAGLLSLFSIINLKKYQKKNLKVLFLLSLVLLTFSSFTYAAQRVFIPLILFSVFLLSYSRKSSFRSLRYYSLLLFFLTSSVIALSLLSPENRGRAGEEAWKGLSHDQLNRLEELYVQAGSSEIKIPPRATWLFHNKYSHSVISFLERYLDHFSPSFLFFQGEASNEKIPDMGVLLFVDILLLPAAFIFLYQKNNFDRKTFLILWLLIAPIASALTRGGAHINRASMMIPVFAVLSGFGIVKLINLTPVKIRLFSVLFLAGGVIFSCLFALNQIFIQKPQDKPWLKEQVYKDVVLNIMDIKENYDTVVAGDDDYIYFLYYGKISPEEFRKRALITDLSKGNWERVEKLDNIVFKMPFNCPKSGKLEVLYVCSGNEVPQNSKLLKTFYYKDNIPAFTFIEFYPLSKMPSSLPKLPENLHYMVEVESNPNYPDGIIPESSDTYW